MKLYHGTSEAVARLAMTEGLRPRSERGDAESVWTEHPSSADHVYLTTAYAPYFAQAALDIGGSGGRMAIIEIDTDLLPDGEDSLVPDEDWLEQATRGQEIPDEWSLPADDMAARTAWFRDRLYWFAHLWDKSIEGLGNCAHEGTIPPDAITRVSFIDPAKIPKQTLYMIGDPSIGLLNYRFTGAKYRTLTRWFMGDDVDPASFILPDGLGLGTIPPEMRAMFDPQITAMTEALSHRNGLSIVGLAGGV